ncbi:hypothetical protein GA0116959_105168 [Acinetobacter albensis]|uniref:Uncharacterized protein n=1 Tax=Acinetobacter albensis TaxID=1673609 RepID=A0A1C4GU58_9GAMM|nr:hypothetical protein GA0116959_105168 [Acinetobacter albensis]
MVPCLLPVKFHEDHFYLFEAYRGFIGRVVAVQVLMSTWIVIFIIKRLETVNQWT